MADWRSIVREIAADNRSGATAITGRAAEAVKLALRERGINTSSPGRDDAVIDMDEKGAASALRISPHYYNTKDEIDTAVAAIAEELKAIPVQY